ncbi:MAG: hypothetical protein WBM07_17740 [Chitinivibrionales bacterium]
MKEAKKQRQAGKANNISAYGSLYKKYMPKGKGDKTAQKARLSVQPPMRRIPPEAG